MQRKPRILIVEDDAFYREFLLRTLDKDYFTDTAEDGLQALTQLSVESYDLILCDLRMPGISGKELIHKIRQSSDDECVLIIITGFEKDWSPVDATDAQVFAYLKKGKFGPKELRKVVQNGLLVNRENQQKKRNEERLRDFNQKLEDKVEENSKALFESEEKYWNLFEQSLVGVYVEAHQRIRFANGKLCEILGCPLEEMLNRSVEDFFRPVPCGTPLPQGQKKDPASSPFQEVLLSTRDGEERHALHSSGTILFEGTTATQGCVLDITEWKVLEQQLLQTQKMESLGTLISGITHEFNNILGAILPQAEILLLGAKENPSLQRPAEIIATMAEKASRLTRQLLDTSRTAVMEKKPVEVNTWIREALSFLGPTLGASVLAKIDLAPDAGWIQADPQHLDQLLMNLVLNARDAMPEGGKIRISTASGAREAAGTSAVEISVEDTGSGIPEKIIPKIFDPFFTTKETGKGTGMGLSVVYNLVKQNGGEIHVTSKPGQGTVFRVLFPSIPLHEEVQTGSAWNGTVLVAEKNPGRQNLIRDVLARMRFEVIPARDDREAEEICSQRRDGIDWIIMDGDFLDHTAFSPVTRLLDSNPRIRMLVTGNEEAGSPNLLPLPLTEKGGRIQFFKVPEKQETLFESLGRVLSK